MLRPVPSATGSPPSCRMIAAVDTDSPREVFFRVASEMFSDGNFNWGRVVALFYFASKLVLKVGGCRAGSPGRLPSNPRGAWEAWRQPPWQPRRTKEIAMSPLSVPAFMYPSNRYLLGLLCATLYSAPRMQHQTKRVRSLLTSSDGC